MRAWNSALNPSLDISGTVGRREAAALAGRFTRPRASGTAIIHADAAPIRLAQSNKVSLAATISGRGERSFCL